MSSMSTTAADHPAPLRPGTVRADVPVPVQTSSGTVMARMVTFAGLVDEREHIALVFGDRQREAPLVRVHSECLTGDVFGSGRCDCGPQLREAVNLLAAEGGFLLYMRQEGRGIGLYNKLDAYLLQDQGLDTFAANRELDFADDLRDYRPAVQMLAAFSVRAVHLITNNPDKARQLDDNGVEVRFTRTTSTFVRNSNRDYLLAKKFAGHRIQIPDPERT
ncbi:GTP cyclohydrolase II RibA [Streptomyces ziwulingensis]|uniref:GTP cyclohydrolase II n=1 Tax=Streptomyces ziwulingensis TaxID=1045501 RepID=A0ABP9AS89_9ACTN